jgi:hypothetical protein
LRGGTDLNPMVKAPPSLERCLQILRKCIFQNGTALPKTVLGGRRFQLSDSPWNSEQSEAEYPTRRQPAIPYLAKARLCSVKPVKEEGERSKSKQAFQESKPSSLRTRPTLSAKFIQRSRSVLLVNAISSLRSAPFSGFLPLRRTSRNDRMISLSCLSDAFSLMEKISTKIYVLLIFF